MAKYERGSPPKMNHRPESRPPKMKAGVANDVAMKPRSALMPPPTKDTQEPRMSKRTAKSIPPSMKRVKHK